MLIAPLVPHLNGANRVNIAPDGLLHAIPFDALFVPDRHHYWIQDVTVLIAPSLTLLATRAPAPSSDLPGCCSMPALDKSSPTVCAMSTIARPWS
jgi:hypothetical protein